MSAPTREVSVFTLLMQRTFVLSVSATVCFVYFSDLSLCLSLLLFLFDYCLCVCLMFVSLSGFLVDCVSLSVLHNMRLLNEPFPSGTEDIKS